MNMILVYNPKSGSALDAKTLRAKCSAANITIDSLIAIDDQLDTKLAPYIEQAATIGVIGGDGTVSAVAGLVANTQATLVPLPGGTLNHFTKDLGIPQDIDEALQQAATNTPRTIDIARINDTYFINNSSLGLYPASLRQRQKIQSRLGKWPAAVVASLQALFRFKTYRVTIDDHTFTTAFIFVGNNRYTLDPLANNDRTSLSEGILTVYISAADSYFDLIKTAFIVLIGRTDTLHDFGEYHPTTLTIETKKQRPIAISHDGEVSMFTPPLTYTIEARALRIR